MIFPDLFGFGWRADMRRIANALEKMAGILPPPPDPPPGSDEVSYYDDERAAKLELLERAKQAGLVPEDTVLPEDEPIKEPDVRSGSD